MQASSRWGLLRFIVPIAITVGLTAPAMASPFSSIAENITSAKGFPGARMVIAHAKSNASTGGTEVSFEQMNESPTVRIGCGPADAGLAIVNLASNGAEIVGLCWGGILLITAVRLLIKGSGLAWKKFALSLVVVAGALSTPGLINFGISALQDFDSNGGFAQLSAMQMSITGSAKNDRTPTGAPRVAPQPVSMPHMMIP